MWFISGLKKHPSESIFNSLLSEIYIRAYVGVYVYTHTCVYTYTHTYIRNGIIHNNKSK